MIPRRIGRYRLVGSLGPTAMGSAYRARDRVEGRDVRVHVLRPDKAADDAFVARFFRGVMAAGAIDSESIAPILEFGEDRGAVFVVVGAATGRSFAELIRLEAPMEPNHASALILGAARGLWVVHEQGLAHGGLTPDSLLVDEQGRVQILDLGQAIGPVDRDVEIARLAERSKKGESASESPPHPEKDRDIAALGALLSALIAGGEADRRPALSEIAERMSASSPIPIAEAVSSLESFLGIPPGPLAPPAGVVSELESARLEYESTPLAVQGPRIVLGILGGCVLLGLFAAILHLRVLAAGFLTLALLTAIARGLVSGLLRGSPLLSRLRALAVGRSAGDWLSLAAFSLMIGVALAVFGVLKAAVALAGAAALIAIGLEFEVDRRLVRARRAAIDRVRAMLAELRGKGVSEESLRRFLWKFAGDRNESFAADVIGWEAVDAARRDWGPTQSRFDVRDPDAWISAIFDAGRRLTRTFARVLDDRLAARRRLRQWDVLRPAEERGGVAIGVNLLTARRRSRRVAAAMIARADAVRRRRKSAADPSLIASSVLAAAVDPESYLAEGEADFSDRREGRLLMGIAGIRSRFVAGIVLLAGCLAWTHQNEVVSAPEIRAVAEDVYRTGDATRARQAVEARIEAAKGSKPLKSPILPGLLADLFRDFGPGVAGLLLLVSTLFRGHRAGLAAIAAAILIMILHPFGFLTSGPKPPPVAIGGVLVMIFGVAVGLWLLASRLDGANRA